MKKVLLVDDHPVVRAAVRLVLELEGFKRISEASSGSEAISLLHEHSFNLVVLDLVMPGGDGLELLERIRASDWSCLVLVFTSLDPLFFQERCMRAGAMAYVAKTNDLSQLHKAVHAVMTGYTYFARLPSGSQDARQRSEKQMIDKLSYPGPGIAGWSVRGWRACRSSVFRCVAGRPAIPKAAAQNRYNRS